MVISALATLGEPLFQDVLPTNPRSASARQSGKNSALLSLSIGVAFAVLLYLVPYASSGISRGSFRHLLQDPAVSLAKHIAPQFKAWPRLLPVLAQMPKPQASLDVFTNSRVERPRDFVRLDHEAAQIAERSVARNASWARGLPVDANLVSTERFYLSALGLALGAATLFFPGEVFAAVANQGAATMGATGADFEAIFRESWDKAVRSGKAGAVAAIVQIFTLMWLHTSMTYQYRYGGDLIQSLKKLSASGGSWHGAIRRFYRGLPFALLHVPTSRFGDIVSNVATLNILDAMPETAGLPVSVKQAAASFTAGLWRVIVMPFETSQTVLQVEDKEGFERFKKQLIQKGPAPLYRGAFAAAFAAFAVHYPWYFTYNFLDDRLPYPAHGQVLGTLIRSAFLGVAACCASDSVSNFLRVIKTQQQTAVLDVNASGDAAGDELSFMGALRLVLRTGGLRGLLGWGLKTRFIVNTLQGAVFSVCWKYFQAIQVAR